MIKPTEKHRAALEAIVNRDHDDCVCGELFHLLHNKQREVITSKRNRKVWIASRRVGKTRACVSYVPLQALYKPRSSCLYVATTRDHARELFWRPFSQINDEHELKVNMKESELRATFPNGSTLWLAGAKDRDDIEKFRGYPWDLVILDEVGSFKTHIEELIDDVLDPGLRERRGTLLAIGTPPPVCRGYLFDITHDVRPGFAKFHGTLYDNPNFPLWAGERDYRPQVDKLLDEVLKEKGWTKKTPTFRREWLGEWADDADALVLHPPASFAEITELPPDTTTTISVDIGYNDNSAFIAVSHSQIIQKVWERESYCKRGMTISAILDKAVDLAKKYDAKMIVLDPAAGGKNVAGELSTRYGIDCCSAEKIDKAMFLRMLDDDLCRGIALMIPNGETHKQCKYIPWNEDRTREAEGVDCDLMDAYLYAWRYALHFIKKEVPKIVDVGSDAWAQKVFNETANKADPRTWFDS